MGNMSKRELDLRSDKKNMYSGRSRRTFANVNGFFFKDIKEKDKNNQQRILSLQKKRNMPKGYSNSK